MSAPRWPGRARAAAWAGAAVLAALAALAPAARAQGPGGGGLPAGAPAQFAGQAVAAGEHYVVDSTPPLTPVNELISTYAPEGVSTLDSSGNADALASTLDARGAAEAPAFLCLAGAPCPPGFPPANPLDARASYPDHPDATGLVSYLGTPLSLDDLVGFTPGAVRAHADPTRVTTLASTTDASTAAGIPGVVTSHLPSPPLPGLPDITAASVRATTAQYFLPSGAFVVQATSRAAGVTVGGVLRIDSLVSTARAVLDGVHAPQVSVSTTVTGASVAGVPVGIDSSGVHLAGVSDHGQVTRTLGDGATVVESASAAAVQLASAATELAHVGIRGGLAGIHLVGTSVSHPAGGMVTAQAGGLELGFTLRLSGAPALALPAPPPPVCQATDPIFSALSLPVSLCALPGFDPNARYFGTVTLAAAGIAASAGPGFSPAAGGAPPGGGAPAAGSVTLSSAAGAAVPAALPAAVPAATAPAATAVPPPRVALGGQARRPVLGLNPAARVKLVAGALLLAAAGSLAGRLRRLPARLPAGG